MSIVETAIIARITSVSTLTDLVFYYHHKHLIGVCLTGADIELVAQWKSFRDMIAARVRRVSIKGGQGNDYIFNSSNGRAQKTMKVGAILSIGCQPQRMKNRAHSARVNLKFFVLKGKT